MLENIHYLLIVWLELIIVDFTALIAFISSDVSTFCFAIKLSVAYLSQKLAVKLQIIYIKCKFI